jgi:hypothetical protein
MTASALHSATASLEVKKSANASIFAGRARAVGVTMPAASRLLSDRHRPGQDN